MPESATSSRTFALTYVQAFDLETLSLSLARTFCRPAGRLIDFCMCRITRTSDVRQFGCRPTGNRRAVVCCLALCVRCVCECVRLPAMCDTHAELILVLVAANVSNRTAHRIEHVPNQSFKWHIELRTRHTQPINISDNVCSQLVDWLLSMEGVGKGHHSHDDDMMAFACVSVFRCVCVRTMCDVHVMMGVIDV